MLKIICYSAIAITSITLMACGAGKSAASVAMTDADVARAAAKFPGATMASLNEGKMHFEENCGKCHGLKKPGNYTESEWREEVPPMADKAKIDKKKEDLILQYVVTMAKQ